MLKTLCFFLFLYFSSLGGICKASFFTAWANSRLRKCGFLQAKRTCFYHVGKKVWKCSFDVRIPMPKVHTSWQLFFQTCHKHFGSSSKMEVQMEALCLHWFLHGTCPFGQKRLASFFSKCGVQLLASCDNKAVVELQFTRFFCARSVQGKH